MGKTRNTSIATGVDKAYYAIFNETDKTYGEVHELGELISFAITPSENSSSLYAGDRAIITDSALTASGNIVVPALSNEDVCRLYGYQKDEKGAIIYSSKAVRPVVGLVLIQNNYGGVQDTIKLMQCKITLGEKSGSTKTDSLTFSNTTVNFTIQIPEDGNYMSIASSDETGFVAFNPASGFLGRA